MAGAWPGRLECCWALAPHSKARPRPLSRRGPIGAPEQFQVFPFARSPARFPTPLRESLIFFFPLNRFGGTIGERSGGREGPPR